MAAYKHVLVLAAAALGGCMVQQQAAVAPAPHPVVTAPAQGRFLNKAMLAGSTIEVDHVSALNPDCSPTGPIVMRITQEPVHGTAIAVERPNFPSYPIGNPRSACNTRRVPGTAMDYTPVPGFVGSDFFTYDIFTPDGRDMPTKAAITVK